MQPDATPAAQEAAPAAAPALVARPSHYWRDYRAKRLALAVGLIAVGLWFAYDGFVAWPRENQRIKDLGQQIETARRANDEPTVRRLDAERSKLKEHSNLDLLFQKFLAFSLPPIGLAVLVWSFYQSRGSYRLENDVLHVPGHPPIPLDAITSIDKTNWERKGFVYIDYELPAGTKGRFWLDDFIYERPPTDAIFEHIERYTGTADPKPPAPSPA